MLPPHREGDREASAPLLPSPSLKSDSGLLIGSDPVQGSKHLASYSALMLCMFFFIGL